MTSANILAAVVFILSIVFSMMRIKQSEWIDVKDELPAKRQRVLVYRGYGQPVIMTIESNNWHKAVKWCALPELP